MALAQIQFSTDPGKILDFEGKRPADIFNEAILPRVQSFTEGLDEASGRRDEQLQRDLNVEAFDQQKDEDFFAQLSQDRPAAQGQDLSEYSVPLPQSQTAAPQGDFSDTKLKLSNYGYSSDSSPDHNSNVLRIGHANNKLEDGVSAALTKSLAKRHGLKTGDFFEARTSDGKTLRRRYDDTVPTTYKGKKLPETVDLYELSGSNKFGGTVVGIRPLGAQKDT